MKNNHLVESSLRTIFDLDFYTLHDVDEIRKFCEIKGMDMSRISPLKSYAVTPELFRTEMGELETELSKKGLPQGIVVCANRCLTTYHNETFGFSFSYFNNLFYVGTKEEQLRNLGKIVTREAQAVYIAKKLSETNHLLVLERFSTPTRRQVETSVALERDLFAIRSVFGDHLD